ncbi:MAG: LamG-like jellyroll fold domain-containing protein [Planctomycetota bacterium]|jgi:hypothetical protein
MVRKLNLLVSVAAVLCLVGSVSAAVVDWTNATTNRNWCDGGNWDLGVPGPDDTAAVGVTPEGPIIGAGCDANVLTLLGPEPFNLNTIMDVEDDGTLHVQNNWVLTRGGSGTVTINITGTSVVKVVGTGHIHMGPDAGTGRFTMSGDPNVIFAGGSSTGDKSGGEGYINIHGGRFQARNLGFGHDCDYGQINVSGETTEIHLAEVLGFYCRSPGSTIDCNMTGGLIDMGGPWEIGAEDDYPAHTDDYAITIDFDGGRIICSDFDVQTITNPVPDHPDGIPFSMDIDEGAVLEIRKNQKADIDKYIGFGWITGKNGTTTPKVVVVGGHTLVGFNLIQYQASDPSPADTATNVCPVGLTLTWEPGLYAEQHRIFWGTDFDDVNNMTTPSATKSRGDETYDPGSLEYGQTYYWRVDEVNFTDPNTWKGTVWGFSTPSGRAENPSPQDGRRGVVPGSIELLWDPPCYLTGQTLYYGTTFPQDGTWTQVELGPAENSYTIAADRFQNYYWRVDTDDGGGIITGSDWDFRTGFGGLLLRYRFDGGMGAHLPSIITDDSGNGVQFTKYTDGGSVTYGESNPDTTASTASADFQTNAAFYRLDPCGPSEATPDLLRLDGSEYTVEMWIKPRSWTDPDWIWLLYKHGSWGLGINSLPGCSGGYCDQSYRWYSGGSQTAITDDETTVLDEWIHIAVVRDEGGDLGGIYLNGIVQDFGDGEGSGGQNPPDNNSPVWIGAGGLPDGSFRDGFYDGLMDELRIHDIALAPCAFLIGPGDPEFPTCPMPQDGEQEVDPCSVILSWSPGESATSHEVYFSTDVGDVDNLDTSAYLGEFVSPASNSLTLEYGTVYYWRVVEQPGGQQGDVWEFVTEYQIDDPTLLLHYKFDETWGTTAYDASGHQYHGTILGNEYGWDPADGQFGGSRIFDDDTAISGGGGVFSSLSGGVSISLWLKNAYKAGADNWVFDAGVATGYHIQAAVVTSPEKQVLWRAGLDPNDSMTWNLGGQNPSTLEGWHHWVFIKNEDTGELSLYFDTELVASKMGMADTLAVLGPTPLKIGALTGHPDDLEAKMDDFRVYDHVIPESKVIELFRGGDLGQAWRPRPRDGATDVPLDTDLVWNPGDFVDTHRVYFGTSWDDVDDATTLTAGIYKGTQGPNSYDLPGTLDFSTWYYWRIDEVNGPNTWKGKVWRFRTADFLIVDDMESYNPTAGSGNEIFDTWDDGFMNWTGSQVALEYGSGAVAIHGGSQTMKLVYNNSIAWFKYSEIDANTTGPRPGNLKIGADWTETEVSALTLFFYGQPGNDTTEQMYMALEDGSSNIGISNYGDTGGDMGDVAVAEWHQWDMALSDFEDDGVILTNVSKVRMGFGDRDNPVEGGSGIVFVDDIRLYLSKCVPWIIKPQFDFSNNCIVDLADVAMMAEDWLLSDIDLGTVTAPGAAVLHYAFEDTSGSSITDSAGSYTGTFFTDITTAPADISQRVDAGGKSGNSFHFTAPPAPLGYGGIKMPSTVFTDNGISQEITISVWVKNAYPDEEPDSGAFMWEFREWNGVSEDANDRVLAVQVAYSGNEYTFHDQSTNVSYGLDWELHTGWKHYAFVRDDSDLAIYVNGVREAIADSNGTALPTPQLLYLGISADRSPASMEEMHDGFTGNVDEWMIFNYALSATEVAYLATDGTGVVSMDSPYNIYDEETPGGRAVNFKDYALLVESWLEKTYWP